MPRPVFPSESMLSADASGMLFSVQPWQSRARSMMTAIDTNKRLYAVFVRFVYFFIVSIAMHNFMDEIRTRMVIHGCITVFKYTTHTLIVVS